jgi:hypothetical protein
MTASVSIRGYNGFAGVYYVRGGSAEAELITLTSSWQTKSAVISSFAANPADKRTQGLIVYGTSGNLVQNGQGIEIKAAKLELGAVSTLAYDPPADYGEQLALCHRFALALAESSYRATAYTANTVTFVIPTPETLRTTPTLSVAPAVNTVAGSEQAGFTFAYTVMPNSIKVVATKASHGLTDASLAVAACVASAEL